MIDTSYDSERQANNKRLRGEKTQNPYLKRVGFVLSQAHMETQRSTSARPTLNKVRTCLKKNTKERNPKLKRDLNTPSSTRPVAHPARPWLG